MEAVLFFPFLVLFCGPLLDLWVLALVEVNSFFDFDSSSGCSSSEAGLCTWSSSFRSELVGLVDYLVGYGPNVDSCVSLKVIKHTWLR